MCEITRVIPRPKGWSKEFRIIEEKESLVCPCGKKLTFNGCASHGVACELIKPFLYSLAEQRRNGLYPGKVVSMSKYYKTREQCELKQQQYLRVIKKLNRRNRCENCGKIFYANLIKNKSCSKKCAIELMTSKVYTEERNRKVSLACMGRKNKVWNKGITGDEYLKHYQKDGEELDDTKTRMLRSFYTKTSIEILFEKMLLEEGIKFKDSAFINRRQYDFRLLDYGIIVEIDGDYWHGNMQRFPELTERQISKQKEDRLKDQIVKNYGYIILRFWETDVNNDLNIIRRLLLGVINGNEENLRKIEENYTSRGGQYIRPYCAR